MSSELIDPKSVPPKWRPGQLTGLAARKAKEELVAKENAATKNEVRVEDCKDRIGIVFDDSASMHGELALNAVAGTEEFLRSCTPGQTAIAIAPMNSPGIDLVTNLPAVAIFTKGLIDSKTGHIKQSGGTPLLQTLKKLREKNPNLTRAIVFSDGDPDDRRFKSYGIHKEWGLVVDTVFIGSYGEEFMKQLAEITGGIFLKFDPSKSNFATAFKYLSPGLRYMLTDGSGLKEKLEGK